MPDQRRFATSIGASALLHALILFALFVWLTAPHKPMSVPTVDVDLSSIPLPPPPKAPPAHAPPQPQVKAQPAPPAMAVPERQIVAPSDGGEEKEPPPDTRLLSDRNNIVPEELVHKGDGGTDEKATEQHFTREPKPAEKPVAEKPPQEAPPPPPKPPKEAPKQVAKAAPPPPAQPREKARPATRPVPGDGAERLAALPSLDKLLPSAADMARQAPLPEATPQANRSGRDLLNSGGDVFSGRPGSRDYLPRVREGNVTMLNTKADLFAPFVRRVAGRVFENLDLAFSTLRNRRGLGRGRATATVEAIMDRSGRFVSATLTENTGLNTVGVDRLLLGSATPDTFFDANPPSGAEAVDGKIHFVLLVDLMVDSVPDPRTGREGVSYYGVAGVGLK